MRSPLAYTPRPGPLRHAGAGAAALYFGSFAVLAFSFSNPIVLAAAGAGVLIAGLAAGARRALLVAGRYGLALAAVFVVVNGIASQRGETILLRGWDLPLAGQVNVSAEALAEGAMLAGRVLIVMLAFAVLSASVDPDRLLRLLRPVARRSALTATLIARLAPLAARDHARVREAAALRGPAAAPVGRAAILRRLVAGSLDRAVDVAATLELRGYAHGAPRAAASPASGRRSLGFGLAGAALIAVGLAARAAGVGEAQAYPVAIADADGATLALALAIVAMAALPFAGAAWPRVVRWRLARA